MNKYILSIGRTLAHLQKLGRDGAYNHTEECYGFSFPYVTKEQKELANRIVKLLNYEDWQFIEKERR